MVLSTARLHLARWQPEDEEALRPIATDPEVMRYITGGIPWTDEYLRDFIQRQIRNAEERNFCMWKLLLRDPAGPGRMAGLCGLQPLAGTEEIEIGWWLARDLWGRGLATEAARAALDHAWTRAGLSRVVAVAMAENTASRHVMEKLGMRYERDTVHKGFPVVLYAVTRETTPSDAGGCA